MVVAVITVRVVQVSVNQVVDVVTVRHRRVTATRAVNVIRVVALTCVRRTPVGVQLCYLNAVFVVVAVMRAVQVPVMQIAHVAIVLNGDVAAVRAVFMWVILVDIVCHVLGFLFQCSICTDGSAWSRTLLTSVFTWESANR